MQTSSSVPDLLRTAIGIERDAPPDPVTLAPLFPDLEILRFLGQGGMGAVYRVRRRADGAVFALKVVKPGPGQEDAFAGRFAREAEALERLQHPHIVAIHGHGQAGPWCWLLMDLVEGANLREIIATGRLSPAQTLALIPPLCAALQYAHDQGVVHRDLKPENILLDAAGEPHLVDFGLAKLRDPKAGSGLTHTGTAMGTLHYMAPEQVASAKGVDHRADIYALGVVIYELLTGQLPLGRFEAPSQRVQVDVRIDEVVLKALERDPERRWQQMRMVGEAVGKASLQIPRTGWTWQFLGLPAWAVILQVGVLLVIITLNADLLPLSKGTARIASILFGTTLGILGLIGLIRRQTPSRGMVVSACLLLFLFMSVRNQFEARKAEERLSAVATQASAVAPVGQAHPAPTQPSASIPTPAASVDLPKELTISVEDMRVLASTWRKQIDEDPKVAAAIIQHGQPLGIYVPEIEMVPQHLPRLQLYEELLNGLTASSSSLVRVSGPSKEKAKITGRCIHSLIGGDKVNISFTVFLTLDGSSTPLWQGHQSISK